MNVQEYYDSMGYYFDDDGVESERARHAAAVISMPGAGVSVLDIGCGTGGMFKELLDNGAYEVIGIDVSQKMLDVVAHGSITDARIATVCKDFLGYGDSGGFDVAIAFNSYNHFSDPEAFVKKAHSLLNRNGRLTVAYAFGRNRVNSISRVMPAGIARELLPPWHELQFWRDCFHVDCMCDNDQLYILSGTAL